MKVAGYYSYRLFDTLTDTVKLDVSEQRNLITDQGLQHTGTLYPANPPGGTYTRPFATQRCWINSTSSVADVSDVFGPDWLFYHDDTFNPDAGNGSTYNIVTDETGTYMRYLYGYRFNTGSDFIVTKFGVGDDDLIFSVKVPVDSNGNQIVINKLQTDILEVVYEVRIYAITQPQYVATIHQPNSVIPEEQIEVEVSMMSSRFGISSENPRSLCIATLFTGGANRRKIRWFHGEPGDYLTGPQNLITEYEYMYTSDTEWDPTGFDSQIRKEDPPKPRILFSTQKHESAVTPLDFVEQYSLIPHAGITCLELQTEIGYFKYLFNPPLQVNGIVYRLRLYFSLEVGRM